MEKRILGIDLSDTNTLLAYYGIEQHFTYPTVICKTKEADGWLIGQPAFEAALNGSGLLTDKLLRLLSSDGYTTIFEVRYSAEKLLVNYLKKAIELSTKELGIESPTHVVISAPNIDRTSYDRLVNVLSKLGFKQERGHIISRSEAFIYYAMSQSPDLHNNNVGLFSLEDNLLVYYEMKVNKKPKSTTVYAEKEVMDESISTDILKNEAGAKLADKIVLSAASRLLKNKIFSCILLTGKGFESQEWAPNFMRFICNRRKVFVDDEIFARGAGFRGADLASEKPIFPFTCICEGRLGFTVYIDVNQGDRVVSSPILNIGDPWCNAEKEIRLIPFNTKTIDLNVVPMESKQRKVVRIPLDFLPQRPPKTTMVGIKLIAKTASSIELTLTDEGFGEIYPATNKKITREVNLWD